MISYELLGRACGFFLRLTQEECHHELVSRTRIFKTYISNSCFKVSTIMYIHVCILHLIIHIFCPLDICYKKYQVNVLCISKRSCSCPSWWIHCGPYGPQCICKDRKFRCRRYRKMRGARIAVVVYSSLISLHICEDSAKQDCSLCFFKYQAAKRTRGIVDIDPNFLKIGTRWNEIQFQAPDNLLQSKPSPVNFEYGVGRSSDLIWTI